MAHVEIESWIAKTLVLLKSPSEESIEELRSMLVDTIHLKFNGRKQFKSIPPITGSENSEKRSKDSKSGSSEQKHKTSSGGFSPTVTISPDSYASDSDSSSDNSEMVILEEDLACAVCREMMCSAWNQFVECSECHSLYHQQCHNPPIPDSDASDPRVVWYCRNCTKTVSKPKTSMSSSSSSQSTKSSNKMSSGRSNTSSPSFGGKPFGGVSLSSKKSSSSKSVHSSSSSKSHAPNINIISADKRLQIMKKKAARKQEKRPK